MVPARYDRWMIMLAITIKSCFFLQKYQRNMTLRNEAEEGDEEAKKADAPEPLRRGGRKRRHEEVNLFLFIYVYEKTQRY